MKEKRIVRSACRMCHGVCQLLVHMEGDRVVKVTGDPDSPTSRGYICPKGAASPELLYHPDRVLHPLRRKGKRGENKWERISWDEALDEMAGKFAEIRKRHGAHYLGMMHGTGRPYENFGQRFANAFGTPNFTGVAHVCFWPRVYANMVTQGFTEMPVCDVYGQEGIVPRCVIIWGCNLTGAQGHDSSDGMCGGMLQRVMNTAEKVIVIDPRKIVPKADHWLGIRPGTDGALALAMIHVITSEGLVDREFVDNYTTGYADLVAHVRNYTPEWAQDITGIPSKDIEMVARLYATTRPACIQWGNGIDMNMCNFHTARSILILRAITGNLYVPGGDTIFSRPEGTKVKFPYIDHHFAGFQFMPLHNLQYAVDSTRDPYAKSKISRILNPVTLGLKSVVFKNFYNQIIALTAGKGPVEQLRFIHKLKGSPYPLSPVIHPPKFWESIVTGKPYRMKALWIIGANPLVTMTNSRMIKQALSMMEYTVVSDFFITPTAQYADLILPASMWLEYDEVHSSGAHTYSVLARKKITQVGDTLDDQEIFIRLARRLGMNRAFPWKDHSDLTKWLLEGTGLSFEEFSEKGILKGEARYHAYKKDKNFFRTRSRKFEISVPSLLKIGVSPLPIYREPAFSPVSTPEIAREYPLILIGGVAIKPFFLSEGRQIPSLRKHMPDPMVQIHPNTAQGLGIDENDWVWIETSEARVKMRAAFFEGLAENTVSAQFGWWFPEEDPPEYGWKKSSVNLLFGKMNYDPETGSESLKCGLCRVYPVDN